MSEVTDSAGSSQDDFYVGYLPAPAGLSRFVKRAVVVLLLLTALVGVLIAAGQRDPGPAVWEADQPQRFEGIVRTSPYPALEVKATDGTSRMHLLVDQGKHGVAERVQNLDGRTVVIHGHLLQRGDLRLIELADETSPIEVAKSTNATPSPQDSSVGLMKVTLQGEIIDPKCFGGAMKPGDGKTHKACATLCIRGGIPPMFASPQPGGEIRQYLIVNGQGEPLDPATLEAILPYVADPIEVTGAVELKAGRWLLRLNPSDIKRL